jgi:Zn-dependent protease with chaperone function
MLLLLLLLLLLLVHLPDSVGHLLYCCCYVSDAASASAASFLLPLLLLLQAASVSLMSAKDARLGLMGQLLAHMGVVKALGWEQVLGDKVCRKTTYVCCCFKSPFVTTCSRLRAALGACLNSQQVP